MKLEGIPLLLGWGRHAAPIEFVINVAASRDNPYVLPHTRQAIRDARRRAGLTDVGGVQAIQTYDCVTTSEYMAIGHFGLTKPGESPKAVAAGSARHVGRRRLREPLATMQGSDGLWAGLFVRLRAMLRRFGGIWRRSWDRGSSPVTCLIVAAEASDVDALDRSIRRLLTQTHRPLRILVAGAAAAALGERHRPPGVCALRWADSAASAVHGATPDPGTARDCAAELRLLAEGMVLEIEGDPRPPRHMVAAMVERLHADPGLAEVDWRGRQADGGGRLVLARSGSSVRAGAPGFAIRLLSAADVDAQRPLPAGPEERIALYFASGAHGAADAGHDLPYRFRLQLAEPRCIGATTDAATAERLRLLTPRWLLASDASALPGLLQSVPPADPEPGPMLEPVPSSSPPHVVLQADDFTEGGMEQVIIDLARALAARGFRATLVILGKAGPAADRARACGLAVRRLRPEAGAYRAFLRTNAVALVNAHYSTFGAAICARAGVPFVHTLHNMYMWFDAKKAAYYRDVDQWTRAWICVSNNVARYADLRFGLPPQKMIVIPNGCDASFRSSAANRARVPALRRELGLSPAARVVLNVSAIRPAKAHHVLIGAFARVAAASPDVHLVIAGDAPDRDYLQRLTATVAATEVASRVHFVGQRADVPVFLELADVLVMPSLFEGWSLAITEAVLAGLPVIATDVGGAAEQLRGTDGVLVEPAARDLTAVDLQALLVLQEDPCEDLQARLAEALRTVLARGGRRSRLPPDWPGLLRESAYRRYADVFRWLAQGGTPATARYWLRPRQSANAADAGEAGASASQCGGNVRS